MHLLFAAEVTSRQKTALYGSHLLPSRERRELTSGKRKSGLHSKIQVEKVCLFLERIVFATH